MISTVDPAARHTRKSKSNRKDGFRGHVSAEPETGLITDAESTSAAGDAGSDPVVGKQMIARDRFHRPEARPCTRTRAAMLPPPTSRVPMSLAAVIDRHRGNRFRAGERRGRPEGRGPAGVRRLGYGTGAARAAYRDAGHQTVIKPKPLRPACPAGSPSTISPSMSRPARSPARPGTPGR